MTAFSGRHARFLAHLTANPSPTGSPSGQALPTDGLRFDPAVHKPVKIMPVDEPAKEAMVLSTLRHGFRSEFGVLRPAEVAIGRFTPRNGANSAGETAPATPID